MLRKSNLKITNLILFADSSLGTLPVLSLTSPGNNNNGYKFNKVSGKYGPLFIGNAANPWNGEDLGPWKLVNPKANAIRLNKDNTNDIIAIINYDGK